MLGAAVNARLFPGRRRLAKNHKSFSHRDVYHRRLRCEPLEDRRLLYVGVSGQIWSDLDSDGIQDAGEPGVAGVVVEIFYSTDTTIGDADDVSRGIAVSDTDGNYAFSGLPELLYYYEIFRTPAGYTFTTRNAGSDDSIDSDPDSSGVTELFTIPFGQTDNTRDAGLLGAAPAFGFAFSAGAEKNDRGHTVTTDASGNLYVTATFEETVDFDPGPGVCNLTDAGWGDIVVAKYSSTGALVWARCMGGTWPDAAGGITVGSDGSVYTTGNFMDTVDFDPGPGTYNLTSAGGGDIFVSKLDAAGNFVWARSFSGPSLDAGCGIAIADDGSVYTTGVFQGAVDFDPGPGTMNFTAVGTAAFISKLDSSGDFLWACCADGTSWDDANDIVVAGDGNVYAIGTYQRTVDFDPGAGTFNLTSKGGSDSFVWKLDSSGNLVWARSIGGGSDDAITGIALADDDSLYITGSFQGTADFDPGPGTLNLTSAGSYDVFVSKLDSAGNVVWARRMGGGDAVCSSGVALAENGNVYTTGSFLATADFDPGAATFNLVNDGYFDIFISELNSDGDFVWAYHIGGSGDEGSHDIAVSVDGSIYTTGSFDGTVDFDPGPGVFNLTSGESDEINYDIFVSKLRINHAPTDIELSSNSIAENQPSGTAVGTLDTTDSDIGDTFAYTLVSGTGSGDNDSFTMSGDTLQTTASFDYEVKSSYSIRVRSTDQGGLYTEKAFTINVTNVNEAPVLFVDADAAPSGDGLSWETAFDDLQAALAQAAAFNGDTTPANDVDQIWIAEGTYKPSAELEPGEARSACFSLLDGVTLYGGFAGTETLLDERDWTTHLTTLSGDLGVEANNSDNAYTVVYCGENIESTLDGLTVTAGNAYGNDTAEHPEREEGGGVYNRGTLTVTHCTLSSNSARNDGGGIYNGSDDHTATMTVINSIFSGNSAGGGGGICNYDGITTVTSSTISGNSTSIVGGGICNYDGTLMVTNSTISGNSTGRSGGGICNTQGTVIVANSTLSGNLAYNGGGICNYDGITTVTNCTISGNAVKSSFTHFGGGGIYNYNSTLTVTNSTLVGNYGGGIYSSTSSSTVTLNNTIVAKNTAASWPDVYHSFGPLVGSHNLIGDGSGQSSIVDGVDGNIVGTSEEPIDPMFVRDPSDGGDGWGDDPDTPSIDESANDDYGVLRLRYGSAAVDAGDDALAVDGDGYPLVSDIAGNPRIVGRCVDIGAHESCVSARLMGDANLDAVVDDIDAAVLGTNWLKPSGATWSEGDFNDDKRVDAIDAAILAINMGRSVFFFPGDANRDGWVDDVDAAVLSVNWLKPPSAPGDANLDGFVNDADAAALSTNWLRQSGAAWADGDFNRDGRVDAVDATLMACNWETDFTHLLLDWTDGDFNGDGFVNGSDAALMAMNMGRTLMPPPTTSLQTSTAASSAADEADAETQTVASEAVVDDVNDDEAALRAVRYDLDNSGRVDLGDLALFASVYREKPGITTENPYAYAADYDGSGRIDLGDLALFAVHYRSGRPDDATAHSPAAAEASSAVAPAKSQPAALPVEQPVAAAEQLTATVQATISKAPAYELAKKTPVPLPGDANRDGRVDDMDAMAVTRNWKKQSHATWADGDFSGDGRVDDLDTAILSRHWMMTVEESDDDDAHDEVFAEIGVTDDAFGLHDE